MKQATRSKYLDLFVYILPMLFSLLPITCFFGWIIPLILFLSFGEYGRISEHVRQSLVIFLPGGMTNGEFYANYCFSLLSVSNSTLMTFGLISLAATIFAESCAGIGIFCVVKNKEIILPLITKLALKIRR